MKNPDLVTLQGQNEDYDLKLNQKYAEFGLWTVGSLALMISLYFISNRKPQP